MNELWTISIYRGSKWGSRLRLLCEKINSRQEITKWDEWIGLSWAGQLKTLAQLSRFIPDSYINWLIYHFMGGGMAALFAYFCIPAYSMQRSYVKCIPVGPIESFSASVLDFNIISFLLDSL